VLNGLEIVQHLRKQMKFEALPIVMMTNYQGDNIHANAVADVMSSYPKQGRKLL
jgi:CheY-like chemotaxis protein